MEYNTSIQGHKCIGPCVEPKKYILHPTTLKYVIDNEKPFCPIDVIIKNDPVTKKPIHKYIDNCHLNQNIKNVSYIPQIPIININENTFLKLYNNIFNFEDALIWIEDKKNTPLTTRKRIIDCALFVYGESIVIVSDIFTNFIIELFNNRFIDKIYDNLYNYVYCENDKVEIKENNLDINYCKDKRINYIKKKFINKKFIDKFIIRYIKNNKPMWTNIQYHTDNMCENFYKYIIKKIIKK